jgi:predicted site-specific integrase-resolvase
MREKFPQAEIIQDIGSGLNFKRKGLNSILGRLLRKDKLTVVVAHKDRLARFGTEIIEFLISENGGELMVLDKNELSPSQELTQDLLAILTVFSCRMHGLRRYSKQIEEDKNLSNELPEESI